MDRRKVLILVAALVAALGTAVVFLYVRGADSRADVKFAARQVLVANAPIAAGETLDGARAAGKIETRTVTAGSLVPGAVADLTGIPTTDIALTTIYPGEQIMRTKFGTTSAAESPLAIPKGQIAVSVNLDDSGRVAGFVNPGAQVTIFGTDAKGTRVLLPDVRVIGVGTTTTVATTKTDPTGAQTTEQLPRTLFTLALSQPDAEKVIFASKQSSLTFGLRTKDSGVAKDTVGATPSTLFN